MPGQRVVFHVGAHKTGTSLVQRYCRDHVRLLRRRRVGYLGRLALTDLVGWGPELLDDPDRLAGRVRSIARNPLVRTVLASHENTIGRPFRRGEPTPALYPDAAPAVEALGEVLRPYRPTIVLSVRPQAEFLESYYLQTVQSGSHQPFARWFDRLDPESLSWQPLVATLRAVFDDVRILDFRLIRGGQDAYLRSFFDLAGLAFDLPPVEAAKRNASLSAKGLDLALAANRFLETPDERRSMRVLLQTNFSNLDYPRPALLTDEQRAAVDERYAREYDELVAPAVVGR